MADARIYRDKSQISEELTQALEKEYEHTSTAATGAKRDSLVLPYLRTMPLDALAAGACAFEYGGEHYGFRNWEKGLPWQQLIDSCRRHLDSIERRHYLDDAEGGSMLPEHCMFMASSMMLVATMIRGIGEDNRMPPQIENDESLQPKNISRWMQTVLNDAKCAREERKCSVS